MERGWTTEDTHALLLSSKTPQITNIMLYYDFDCAGGFKYLFEVREHGNGVKSRKNALLLTYYKNRKLLQWKAYHNDKKCLSIYSTAALKDFCIQRCLETSDGARIMKLKDRVWRSNDYHTDDQQGRTVDGDPRCIRYIKNENNKVYKMKAGKMYRHLILQSKFGRMLPEAIVNWLCEELTLEWSGYNTSINYTLHVDDDFAKIYDGSKCKGNFGSCMTNKHREGFYENSVKAKAAYLTDVDGLVVARAIIYMDVNDLDSDRKWRLCERQYSTDGDNFLKQVLVNRLIEGGYIDGYKNIGAGCSDSRAFTDTNGNSLSDRRFYIPCSLSREDVLSYQDSFKWYNMDTELSYNFYHDSYTDDLAVTDETLEGERSYDSWHERWTSNELVEVHYQGSVYYCDEDRLDDFISVGGEYYHQDEVGMCEECNDYFVYDDGYYSEYTERDYCCSYCRDAAERRFCEDNPDEFVWHNEEVCRREDLTFCERCGEAIDDGDECDSEITGQSYCSETCRLIEEREYLREHPDCGYAVCEDCRTIIRVENGVQIEDGKYRCEECNEAAQYMLQNSLNIA